MYIDVKVTMVIGNYISTRRSENIPFKSEEFVLIVSIDQGIIHAKSTQHQKYKEDINVCIKTVQNVFFGDSFGLCRYM